MAAPILLLNSAIPPLFACVVREGTPRAVRMASEETRFSSEGIELITRSLEESSLSFDQVDAVAFVAGPGSFTGLRTGLAMLKGLFFERPTPAVSLSTLSILARPFLGRGQTVVPLIDARLGQVYAALFAPDGSVVMADSALKPQELAARLSGEVIVVGADAPGFREILDAAPGVRTVYETLSAEQWLESASALASNAFAAGTSLIVSDLEPAYLRKSYAEQKADP